MATLVPLPDDPRPVIDYTGRDQVALLAAMRALIPDLLPEWTDNANEADAGNVLLELFAHMADVLSYYQDRIANEAFLGTARTRASVIEHLRLIGYRLATASPAAAVLTLSVPDSVTDAVTISRGDAFGAPGLAGGGFARFEYTASTPLTIRFADVSASAGRRVFGDLEGRSGIPVEEGRLFTDQVLGTSDGSPDQRFPIAHPAVILRPAGATPVPDVAVTTTVGTQRTTWQLAESLAGAGHGDRQVAVEVDDTDRATVVFGDGAFGAIPPVGALVSATYRVGGGAAGNVAPGAITLIVDAPALSLLGGVVTNPQPASGGAERESIDHAARRAPAAFRAGERAVTAADYEALAAGFKEVGKVRARRVGWNGVELVVAVSGGQGRVSDTLEAALQNLLSDKQILGQTVQIVDVDYVPVQVSAVITVLPGYVPAAVAAAAQSAGAGLLAFDAVDFDQPLYLSAFYQHLQDVPGVQSVDITEFRAVAGDPTGLLAAVSSGTSGAALDQLAAAGVIRLGPAQLPTAPRQAPYDGGLNLIVRGSVGASGSGPNAGGSA